MNKHTDEQEFLLNAKKILEAKGFTKDHPALNELIGAIHFDQCSTQRKILWYKWPGLILLVATPLISALISIAIASSGDKNSYLLPPNVLAIALPLASLTLTIMTIFDSAFKPAERFKRACKIGIEIQNFKGQLLADLQQLSTEEELNKYIPQKRQKFTQFSMALVDLFLPETISASKLEELEKPHHKHS
jgi:hypothetical protein